MGLDGKAQTIGHSVKNDRPIVNEIDCECGGTFYASPSSRFVSCTGGEVRCAICRRTARRFGKNYTCGFGCRAHE